MNFFFSLLQLSFFSFYFIFLFRKYCVQPSFQVFFILSEFLFFTVFHCRFFLSCSFSKQKKNYFSANWEKFSQYHWFECVRRLEFPFYAIRQFSSRTGRKRTNRISMQHQNHLVFAARCGIEL